MIESVAVEVVAIASYRTQCFKKSRSFQGPGSKSRVRAGSSGNSLYEGGLNIERSHPKLQVLLK